MPAAETAESRRYCASAPRARTHKSLVSISSQQMWLVGILHPMTTSTSARPIFWATCRIGHFDFIYCQEVLHHTADPKRAFHNVSSLLSAAGEYRTDVYKQKAPIREFVDDYIRDRIAALPYEEAMKTCEQITALGKALSGYEPKWMFPPYHYLASIGSLRRAAVLLSFFYEVFLQ